MFEWLVCHTKFGAQFNSNRERHRSLFVELVRNLAPRDEYGPGAVCMQAMSSNRDAGSTGENIEQKSRTASVGLFISAGCLGTVVAACAPFLRTFSGAPYVASSLRAQRAIQHHLDRLIAERGKGLRLIDLGSGSGDIVLAAARKGFHATGVELNPWLVAVSRIKARRAGLAGHAVFLRQDLWRTCVKEQDVVVCFGVPAIMSRLRHKLEVQGKKDAWVCSNTFEVPGWKPSMCSARVYFYCLPGNT